MKTKDEKRKWQLAFCCASSWKKTKNENEEEVKIPYSDGVGSDCAIIRELKHAHFWDADGNRKWAVYTFNLPSHNHVHIAKYLFSIRDK